MILARRTRHVARSFRNTRVNSAGVLAKSNFGEESRAPSAGGSDKRHTSGAITPQRVWTFPVRPAFSKPDETRCGRGRFSRKHPIDRPTGELVARTRDLSNSSE